MMFMNIDAAPAPWYKPEEVEDLKKAWEDGKDFKMLNVPNPQYFSVRDSSALYKGGVLAVYLHPNAFSADWSEVVKL